MFELVYKTKIVYENEKFSKCLDYAKYLHNKKGYTQIPFEIREILGVSVVNEDYFKDKNWNELSISKKKRAIFNLTELSRFAFWQVCGKDRQHYYQDLDINDTNVDKIRDDIYNEYINALEKADVLDKDIKIAKAKKLLF